MFLWKILTGFWRSYNFIGNLKFGKGTVAIKAIFFNAEDAGDVGDAEEGINLGKGAIIIEAMFFTTEVTEEGFNLGKSTVAIKAINAVSHRRTQRKPKQGLKSLSFRAKTRNPAFKNG